MSQILGAQVATKDFCSTASVLFANCSDFFYILQDNGDIELWMGP